MSKPIMLVGDRKLLKTFNRLKGGKQRQAMRAAAMGSGRIWRKSASQSAPVRSGALKKSINIKQKTYSKSNSVFVTIRPAGKSQGYEYYWGDQIVYPEMYGPMVEGGTRRGIQATHFMRRSANRTSSSVERKFSKTFGDAIVRIAKASG